MGVGWDGAIFRRRGGLNFGCRWKWLRIRSDLNIFFCFSLISFLFIYYRKIQIGLIEISLKRGCTNSFLFPTKLSITIFNQSIT